MAKGRTDMHFDDPRLTKLNFFINKDFKIESSVAMNIKISMHSEKQEDNDSSEGFTAYISTLKIDIGEESDVIPFYCEIEMSGTFFLKDDSEIHEDTFAKANTAAILYSYARPIVSDTVSKSGLEPYNLPFINFTEENNIKFDDNNHFED